MPNRRRRDARGVLVMQRPNRPLMLKRQFPPMREMLSRMAKPNQRLMLPNPMMRLRRLELHASNVNLVQMVTPIRKATAMVADVDGVVAIARTIAVATVRDARRNPSSVSRFRFLAYSTSATRVTDSSGSIVTSRVEKTSTSR
jgi:hypothetical protein